jgi:hypothetical protein
MINKNTNNSLFPKFKALQPPILSLDNIYMGADEGIGKKKKKFFRRLFIYGKRFIFADQM